MIRLLRVREEAESGWNRAEEEEDWGITSWESSRDRGSLYCWILTSLPAWTAQHESRSKSEDAHWHHSCITWVILLLLPFKHIWDWLLSLVPYYSIHKFVWYFTIYKGTSTCHRPYDRTGSLIRLSDCQYLGTLRLFLCYIVIEPTNVFETLGKNISSNCGGIITHF